MWFVFSWLVSLRCHWFGCMLYNLLLSVWIASLDPWDTFKHCSGYICSIRFISLLVIHVFSPHSDCPPWAKPWWYPIQKPSEGKSSDLTVHIIYICPLRAGILISSYICPLRTSVGSQCSYPIYLSSGDSGLDFMVVYIIYSGPLRASFLVVSYSSSSPLRVSLSCSYIQLLSGGWCAAALWGL